MDMLEKIVTSMLMNARAHRVLIMGNVFKDLILHFIHCRIEIHCHQFFLESFHMKMQAAMSVVSVRIKNKLSCMLLT